LGLSYCMTGVCRIDDPLYLPVELGLVSLVPLVPSFAPD
jgi:hypothetical protein